MLIKPAHYEHMRDAIAALLPNVEAYRAAIAADPRVKNPSRRLLWDLLYRAKLSAWICETLYPYADDSHIDTALKRIGAELGL